MESVQTGADALVAELARAGVTTIFCITGAGNLAIVDALVRHGGFEIVYSHHEQAAVMEAQGYARISGTLGVALVTTGGGTSNAVTGVLSAHLDSVPVLLISGNESSFHCSNMREFRAYGVQGFDSVAVMRPVCKSSRRVATAEDCASEVVHAMEVALTPRTGPVHVDVPMDLQRRTVSNLDVVNKASADLATHSEGSVRDLLDELTMALAESARPLVYIGNGARQGTAASDLVEFLEAAQIPFALSWSALDLLNADDRLDVGRIGIYGDRAANILLQQADLLVCIGTRLAIPQIGYNKPDFARMAERWVLDIDAIELTKFEDARWRTICVDAQVAAQHLRRSMDRIDGSGRQPWLDRVAFVKAALPRLKQAGVELDVPGGNVHSQSVMEYLNAALDDRAIVVTDVGAGLLTGHYALDPKPGQRVFTSQGLGEMGFGLPGAIGAYFADKTRQIVCLDTDGGLMFNLQELEVVRGHTIPLKLFVFNNSGYAMIRISQNNLFDGRLAGSTMQSGLSLPDFERLADAFDFNFTRVSEIAGLERDVTNALRSPRAEMIEITMSPEQRYLPRLATVRLPNGDLVSPPLEDLDPLIPISQLEELLGYEPTTASRVARGLDG